MPSDPSGNVEAIVTLQVSPPAAKHRRVHLALREQDQDQEASDTSRTLINEASIEAPPPVLGAVALPDSRESSALEAPPADKSARGERNDEDDDLFDGLLEQVEAADGDGSM